MIPLRPERAGAQKALLGNGLTVFYLRQVFVWWPSEEIRQLVPKLGTDGISQLKHLDTSRSIVVSGV
jgi:hypothetical protein